MERVIQITRNNFDEFSVMVRVINAISLLRRLQRSRKCSYPLSFILKRARINLPPAYRSVILNYLKELPSVDVRKVKKKGKPWYRVVIYK